MAESLVSDTDRQELVTCYDALLAAGLGTGSSGNVSSRTPDGMLITPTGASPGQLQADQTVSMSLTGEVDQGQMLPSSEWHMHAAVYQSRPDIGAIVHCHSRFATTIACTGRAIPAIHYMIAVTGLSEVPLVPYATFGTEALAQSAAQGLAKGRACLLANHGQLAAGTDLAMALKVAVEVEELAAIYWHALAIGQEEVLSGQQMKDVEAAFVGYGQQRGTE
ncbi:MAG: class II aldolase/adducin family protein [Halieaceae bacterium]